MAPWKYTKCSTDRWITDTLLVSTSFHWTILNMEVCKYWILIFQTFFICVLSSSQIHRTLFLQPSNKNVQFSELQHESNKPTLDAILKEEHISLHLKMKVLKKCHWFLNSGTLISKMRTSSNVAFGLYLWESVVWYLVFWQNIFLHYLISLNNLAFLVHGITTVCHELLRNIIKSKRERQALHAKCGFM